jgi:hypothetical protein
VRSFAAESATVTLVTVFNYPGTKISTKPHGIDNYGNVVGLEQPQGSVASGFERLSDGTFINLQDPSGSNTQAYGINDLGEIDGVYTKTTTSVTTGFTLVNGTYTDFLEAPQQCPVGTPCASLVDGLNNQGDVVGAWFPPHKAAETPFVVLNGVFASITGAPIAYGGIATAVSNDGTHVAGMYEDGVTFHGFIYTVASRTIKTIDYPGATATELYGVNNQATITGHYTDAAGAVHGFARMEGQWVGYDYPGATLTTLERVNDDNLASGAYEMGTSQAHGLIVQIAVSSD